jgi:endonuclease/exonuclease/phosphatase family metal-dependent hydrolase
MATVPKPKEPAFLTGDFNVDEANPVVPFVEGKSQLNGAFTALPLKDTFREVHPGDKAVGTFHAFTGDTTGAKIDYIFVLPRLQTVSARILHDHVGTHWPSDHFPVIAGVAVPDWATTSIRRD